MAVKLKEEANRDDCRVYTTAVTPGYPHEPPYNNCVIICGLDPAPPLMETCVYTGSYEKCVEYAKNNCKDCENRPE